MTLYQIIKGLEEIAKRHPNIRTAADGSIYTIMNANPSVKYGTFIVTQNQHRQTEMFDIYGLTLFYVDRLVDNREDNRLQIQSIGKQVLGNIIQTFCETYDVDFPLVVRYTPFSEKFKDECAGMYVQIELEIIKDNVCSEEFD